MQAYKDNSVELQSPPTVDRTTHMTRAEAASYLTARGLKIAASSLAASAVSGRGPKYTLWGNRAVYLVADLDAWAQARLGASYASTAARDAQS